MVSKQKIEEIGKKLLKAMKRLGGQNATSRIVSFAGVNTATAKPVLEILAQEKKIIKIEETRATYWTLK